MKKSLQITLKDNTVIALETIIQTTQDTLIKVLELLEKKDCPLLLLIQHQQLNTLLELSKVSPFILLYFDAENSFSGAAYSTNLSSSPFYIQTQYKSILLIPLSSNYEVNQLLDSLFFEIIE